MITWRSVCLAAVVLSAFASTTFADKEAKKLDGTWRFLSLMSDGREAPKEAIQKWRWVIRDKVLTIAGGGKYSLEIDPSKSPKALDMTRLDGDAKGKTFRCIYKLEEGRLTICFPKGKQDTGDKARPREFDG